MRGGRALAALVLAASAALCVGNLRRASATVDEANHLHAGYRALAEGDFGWNEEHPPLAKMLAAAPLLALHPATRPVEAPPGGGPREPAQAREAFDAFAFRDNPPAERLFLLGRLPIVALGLGLCAAVGLVARARHGGAAGLLALALAAFDPNLLAHSGLVTTDVAVALFSFLAVVAFARALAARSLRADGMAGLALGLAQASKHTALLLYPILGVLALARSASSPRGTRLWPFRSLGVACALSFFVLWGCYGFQVGRLGFPPEKFSFLPEALGIRALALRWNEGSVPMPSFAWGVRYNVGFAHRGGWPAFFLGRTSEGGGFLAYYPVAFLVKTPLATLALLAAGLSLRGKWRLSLRRDGDLLFAAAAFFGTAVASRINLGIRHILPVYPFLFVLASRTAPAALEAAGRLGRASLATAGVGLVASTAGAFPHFLAYFHEGVGGAEGGRRILLDSNLDWGQDLIGLRDWLAENRVESVKLHYFGTAPPEAYGIAWQPMTDAERFAPGEGVFAVSAMSLANVRADARRFAWLLEREPDAKVGHTIWVWDLRPGRRGGEGRPR
ncbi:MAG TPA: glycosyltransferase family 39 protein [Planctomycetota bacterium]|jgi:4-amino-4-deoxy-L-arabinose transferase-like glycosyltransferase|nr:glycosyltransferase family 39 protein [Planctomycetota bacterium]